jgi:hypothetical protein
MALIPVLIDSMERHGHVQLNAVVRTSSTASARDGERRSPSTGGERATDPFAASWPLVESRLVGTQRHRQRTFVGE